MRIIVTGSKGQLGAALLARLSGQELLGLDLPDFDITVPDRVSAVVGGFRPDLVIHPAAMTNVDQCERDPSLAFRINALGTYSLALACRASGAAMVYISTDYVFDGRKDGPYYEDDLPAPLSAYGRSKLAGEWATRAVVARHYVVRPAWMYAPGGRNFVQTVLRLAREKGALTMVTDERGSPTYAPDVADAIARLVLTGRHGTYHFTNAGVCSRYEWACEILRQAGLGHIPVAPSQGYSRPAPVPSRVELRNVRGAELGIVLRPWQEALAAYFEACR